MEKIFIIDAVNFLFRSYYAIGPMTNDKGQSTSALYGFIRSVQKMQNDFSFPYMIAVFDGPDNKRSRQEVYAAYKMHRKGAPEDLFPQFEHAYNFCHLAGIATLCIEGVEADDTMASVALWAEKQGLEAYICTSDKDLLQMVSEHVFVLNVHKENLLMNKEKVKELLGIYPEQVLDYLSIMGDSSDNIPGLEGFGPKTAAALLQEFGTLENILDHPEKVKGEKKQEILRTQKDTALMSKKLASLDTHVVIPHELEFYKRKDPDINGLKEFYHQMKFMKLLQNLGPLQEEVREEQKEVEPTPIETNYTLINDEASFHELLEKLSKAKEISIDTETTDIRPLFAKLVGVGFCIKPGIAYYVPLNGNIPETLILQKLKELLENPRFAFLGHNIKYDFHVFQNYNITIANVYFDTLLASYLINPQHRRHNLDYLSLEYFNKTKISYDSLVQEGKKIIPLNEVDIKKVAEYCSEDVDFTLRLKSLFEKTLKKKNLMELFQKIEMPLLPILAQMERAGIYVDLDLFDILEKELKKEIERIEKEIFQEVGKEFNLNSPKQLSDILYNTLNLPRPKKQSTEFATGADILEKLSVVSPVVEKILGYRGMEKLLTTYIEALPKQINPKTGRIHANFQQSVTATGRLSCQDPNLQNIPLHSEGGKKIRAAFKPQKPGWSYLSSDYSQIELRLLAHFSEDPKLLHAFKNKEDIHAHTASLVYNVPIEMVTRPMRQAAKTVNFGILYGQGPYGLAQQLNISTKEAEEFINIYFAQYKEVKPFLEQCKKLAEERGYATTLMGRQRPLPEIHNQNLQIKAAAYRLAINTPLQGTSADIIKMAMIDIDQKLKEKSLQGYMILQIHDELLFEIPDEEIEIFEKIVKTSMEKVVHLKVPLVVDIEIGKNWGEC